MCAKCEEFVPAHRKPEYGMVPAMTRLVLTALVATAALVPAATAAAHPARQGLPLAMGDLPERVAPAAHAAKEPSLDPVPRPECAPGGNPETGIQGRVPAGSTNGFTCNTTLVGQHGSSGGYKALRFTDSSGRECAYYDTTLLFPSNVQTLSERPTGVAVLDSRSRPRSSARPRCRPRTNRSCSTRSAACSPP
jgi:hypothetical protein